jgi:hypothetical protein
VTYASHFRLISRIGDGTMRHMRNRVLFPYVARPVDTSADKRMMALSIAAIQRSSMLLARVDALIKANRCLLVEPMPIEHHRQVYGVFDQQAQKAA